MTTLVRDKLNNLECNEYQLQVLIETRMTTSISSKAHCNYMKYVEKGIKNHKTFQLI